MCETNIKYKLPAHFSKVKLVCRSFATIYYSNIVTFLQIYPNLIQFTYIVDLNMITPNKFTQKLHKLAQTLLIMLLTLECLLSLAILCLEHQ